MVVSCCCVSAHNSNFVPRTKNDEFFWHEPKGAECLKNHRFECEVRSLLFAAESKKQGQKGPFLTSPDASKNTVFETPWQKNIILVVVFVAHAVETVGNVVLVVGPLFLTIYRRKDGVLLAKSHGCVKINIHVPLLD